MTKKIRFLVKSSIIHGGSQLLSWSQRTLKIETNKCNTSTWTRVLHEHLSGL